MSNNIYIINQQYPPETAATGQIFSVIAKGLASRGEDITVICGMPFYSVGNGVGKDKPPRVEAVDGIKVRRLWNTSFPKSSFIGKAINQFTFMLSLLAFTLFKIKRDAVVMATTAPPLGLVAAALGRMKAGYTLVACVQDLYPDALQAAGGMSSRNLLYRALRGMMQWALNSCRRVVTISTDMAARLRMLYGLPGVVVIPNPSTGNVAPLPHGLHKERHGFADKLVAQYSGNFGLAHEYQTLLSTMRLLRDNEGVVFHIAGGGENFKKLEKEAEGLPNAVFEGFAPLDELSERLSVADISLVIFDAEFRDILLPSKYVGILASGRATLLISGAESDISRDIIRADAGKFFGHGQAAMIAGELARLAEHMSEVRRMGRNARRLYEEKYTDDIVIDKYYNALRS